MADRDVPLVVPCHGVTDEGVRVGDAAREMEGRGLVDVVDDLDAIMAAARSGRAIVALDGCAAGCQARWLDAQGVRSTSTLKLEPAGAGGPRTAAMPQRRARRLPPVAPPAHPNRTNSLDDYLLAVDALTAPVVACGAVVDAPTLAAHVAQILGVSRPAAGEMIGRLEKEGLVFRGERKEVLLTPSGRTAADVLLRRQRILEHFVVETLGYDLADCHEEARGLAPGFDEDALERLWLALGKPDRCPHGRPIDAEEARRTARKLIALSAAQPGSTVHVDRLDEGNRERLRALGDAGIRPGSVLSDIEVHDAAELVSFTGDDGREAISVSLAGSVLVR
ncbi:MAG: iron dependent repressor, metal binding and dimerization domain protein [Gaiella sp.]|uniref:iron dependent repressor, metal binding and dimerization domain protein n=1 Tax=Gaiella sp. TaxID=2663207 RepID=UPI003C78D01E